MKLWLTILISLLVSTASAQTSILTPNGNYLCNNMGFVTSCLGPTAQDNLSILKLGPNAYAVAPMTPVYPPQAPLGPPLGEYQKPMGLPALPDLSPSQGIYGRNLEPASPSTGVPCLSLWREC